MAEYDECIVCSTYDNKSTWKCDGEVTICNDCYEVAEGKTLCLDCHCVDDCECPTGDDDDGIPSENTVVINCNYYVKVEKKTKKKKNKYASDSSDSDSGDSSDSDSSDSDSSDSSDSGKD
jgi:hypothetical protein